VPITLLFEILQAICISIGIAQFILNFDT